MKSTLDQLSQTERETLARLYDSELYKPLKKLLDAEKETLMKQHVGQLDIMQVRYLTGGIGAINKLVLDLQTNAKGSQKN